MKKILLVFLIIFQLILVSCKSNNSANTGNHDGLYITNYQLGDSSGSLVHLDENLNFINTYKTNAGLSVKGINSHNNIYVYGSSQKVSILNTKNNKLSKFESDKGKIKQLYDINNTLWGIDNGYVKEAGRYCSKIINLDSNDEYEIDGYFTSYDIKNEFIYILVQNNNNQYELMKFNTITKEYSLNLLKGLSSENPFTLVTLVNSILFIEHNKYNMYNVNYDNLELANELTPNNFKFSDASTKFVMYYNVNLDEENKLIFLIADSNSKFIKVNMKTGDMKEIFLGIGDYYNFTPLPGVDGDYIYISLVKPDEMAKVRKYNWKTEEFIKEVDISEYIKKNKQISSMYFYRDK